MDRNSKIQPNTLGILGIAEGDETKFGPVIAAGPLSKQPMTVAFRVVLVQKHDGSFAVWTQYFPNYKDGQSLRTDSYLEQGNYYQSSQLVEATETFAKRVANNAGTLASIYRQPDIQLGKTYGGETPANFPRLA